VEIFKKIATSGKTFRKKIHPHEAYDEELEKRLQGIG
jgi:hypothetical protein